MGLHYRSYAVHTLPNPSDSGWHPQARITQLSPFMSRRCRVIHEAQGLSQPLLTLLRLTVCCTEQNTTISFCLANDDSRKIADLTHTKQFLRTVSTIIRFPVVQYIYTWLLVLFIHGLNHLLSVVGNGSRLSWGICSINLCLQSQTNEWRGGKEVLNWRISFVFLAHKIF